MEIPMNADYFDSYSSNESFARVAVAAFMTSLNPTVEEVADVKRLCRRL